MNGPLQFWVQHGDMHVAHSTEGSELILERPGRAENRSLGLQSVSNK